MATYKIPSLGLRMVKEKTLRVARESVKRSDDAAEIARALIGALPTERLIAIVLDGQGAVTAIVTLAQGGMHGAAVSTADVFRAVLASHGSAFVLAHNHPSGNPEPSPQDIAFTRAIAAAGEIVGFPLLDHVIVTRTDAYRALAS